ncbi:MAG: hypothetical protein WA418_03675 [Bradyrhizobium sp.]
MHFATIEEIIEPAPRIRQRAFCLHGQELQRRLLKSQNLTAAFRSNLTRRANHRHDVIVGFSEIRDQAAAARRPRAFVWRYRLLPNPLCLLLNHLRSSIDSACQTRPRIAAVWILAVSRERGGPQVWRPSPRLPRPLDGRDRVRARNDRVGRDLPRFFFLIDQEKMMTAYLISLALLGLVIVAAADAQA